MQQANTDQESKVLIKKELIDNVITELCKNPIKKKTDIFRVFRKMNINKEMHNSLYDNLREEEWISYSRKSPVGYSIRRPAEQCPSKQSEPINEREQLLQRKVPERLAKSEQQVENILRERETVRETLKQQAFAKCPRCSGKMNVRSIRCGPQRVVQVSLCSICNYNIPLV